MICFCLRNYWRNTSSWGKSPTRAAGVGEEADRKSPGKRKMVPGEKGGGGGKTGKREAGPHSASGGIWSRTREVTQGTTGMCTW